MSGRMPFRRVAVRVRGGQLVQPEFDILLQRAMALILAGNKRLWMRACALGVLF